MDVTDAIDYFSPDYYAARERFRETAESIGCDLSMYPIDLDPSLTIDVAVLDRARATRTLIVSSGVHGVEGPFGSAVQLAIIDALRAETLAANVRYVFIHAINPFGYVHHRRWNEENVDLNRNFRCKSNSYEGCPEGYTSFQSTLNPASPPSRLEPFWAKAVWQIARHGKQAIKEAVATGQYEYPRGLFFGGKGECCSARIIRENFETWIGSAAQVVHLDLHTGLGKFGDYRLLLEAPHDSPEVKWFREIFDDGLIEDAGDHQTSYDARGTFGLWTSGHVVDRVFRFATVEVGTHPIVRVLGALRAENRVYHYAKDAPKLDWARRELRECFCPASTKWRRKVIHDQMEVVQRCVAAMLRTDTVNPGLTPVAGPLINHLRKKRSPGVHHHQE